MFLGPKTVGKSDRIAKRSVFILVPLMVPLIYGVPNLGIPLRHILGQIAARPRSTLTPVSNHGFTDPLAAESLENMNKKLGFESVGFLTDGF